MRAAAAVLLLAGAAPVPTAGAGAPAPGAPAVKQTAADDLAATANLVYRTTAEFRFAGLPLRLSVRTTTTWHRDGEHYESHLHMDTSSVEFDQLSEGLLGPEGMLVPTRYTEKRPFHKPEAVAIDWQDRLIQFGDSPKVAAPAAGAQDRLSLQFELARQRLRYPEKFEAGSSHEVRLIGTHDVDPWTFVAGAEESVETGKGPMRAQRYSARRKVGAVEETMDIWLGADLRWMPIRIRMVDRNASVIDSVLQSIDLS